MNVICIPGFVGSSNNYLVYDDNGVAVLIDPTEPIFLDDLIDEHKLRPAAVLLTHGHFDHTFAQNQMKSKYSIQSYLHAADAEMLGDPSKNAADLSGDERAVRFYSVHDYGSADVLLHGGETLTFGDLVFRVHHTPGHTAGSVCYECESCLFTGDTLFRGSVGRTDLYGGDPEALKRSLDYIYSFDRIGMIDSPQRIDTIYPGHGPETTLKYELIMNLINKEI